MKAALASRRIPLLLAVFGLLFFGAPAIPARTLNAASAATQTQLSADPASVFAGEPVTLTASVARVAPASGAPAGTVAFYGKHYWGWESLGTSPLNAQGVASLTFTPSVGLQPVYAKYEGSFDDEASESAEITVEVKRTPTVTRVSVYNTAPVYGEPITATVTITRPNGGITTTVPLYDGTHYLQTVVVYSGVGVAPLNGGFPIGRHCLTASYYGDLENEGSESEPACFEVGRADTRVEIAAQIRPGGGGNMATLDVVVRPVSPGSGTPTGRVQVSLGDLVLGDAYLDGLSHATLTVLGLSNEPHIIRVEYLSEPRFKPSSGALPVGEMKRQYLPFAVRGGPGK
jgi:hypothetical protein